MAIVFLLAGAIMLFTPGQGILVILVGLWLAEFPGKRQLERKIIAIPGVVASINQVRLRAGRSPLTMHDKPCNSAAATRKMD